ncbi:MAG: site-specific DNA-methyltransferase [Chloroflexi bacterium]|nr:site-specific DNA-methyltransferase [Chloroflexota bacterium]
MESPAAMELPTAGQPACAFTLTIGWRPTCECEAGEPAPCVVLDPFGGSGTTAMVAGRLGRLGVAIELNRNYCRMASERLAADVAKQPRHVSTTLSLPMLYGPGGLVAD